MKGVTAAMKIQKIGVQNTMKKFIVVYQIVLKITLIVSVIIIVQNRGYGKCTDVIVGCVEYSYFIL